MKSFFSVHVGLRWEGVVNLGRPVLFLERLEYEHLVWGRYREYLNDYIAEKKSTAIKAGRISDMRSANREVSDGHGRCLRLKQAPG